MHSKSRAPKSTAGLLGSRSFTLTLLDALPGVGWGGHALWGSLSRRSGTSSDNRTQQTKWELEDSSELKALMSVFSYFARRRWKV